MNDDDLVPADPRTPRPALRSGSELWPMLEAVDVATQSVHAYDPSTEEDAGDDSCEPAHRGCCDPEGHDEPSEQYPGRGQADRVLVSTENLLLAAAGLPVGVVVGILLARGFFSTYTAHSQCRGPRFLVTLAARVTT